MLIIGLTGSIGSGKSLASKCFESLGIPLQDSDAEVHRLLRENKGLIEEIRSRWPSVVEDMTVVRHKLGEIVFADRAELKILERMIYPHLHSVHREFLAHHARLKASMVVIDMPLLFETGMDKYMDLTVCIYADDDLRLQRVIRREHMSVEKFRKRDAFQIPQDEKKKRSDVVLYSGLDKGHMQHQVEALVHELQDKKGEKWGPLWHPDCKKD